MTKFVTNASGAIWWPNLEVMQPIQVPLKSILKYLTWIFLATEFASFVAGKIIQVIEAMPGSVVPLAMFSYYHCYLCPFNSVHVLRGISWAPITFTIRKHSQLFSLFCWQGERFAKDKDKDGSSALAGLIWVLGGSIYDYWSPILKLPEKIRRQRISLSQPFG